MTRILWCTLLVLCFLTACRNQANEGYTTAPENYDYKLLAIGDGKQKADSTHSLFCSAIIRTQNDSLFFNSSYTFDRGISIRLFPTGSASGKRHFFNMNEGDSLSLRIGKTCFFREYFDTLVPYFLAKDSFVKLDVKILEIRKNDPDDLEMKTFAEASEDTELQELRQIGDYLKLHYPDVTVEKDGIYILEHTHTALEKASTGKKVRIRYSGFYLNGSPLENGSQQLEFTLGTPDQLVKGLNIVIHTLKKGETTKIIVPSRLAFGESGSTNGSIPPYTPLLYNVTLIDIK